MTVSTATPRIAHTGNGVTTTFPFDFRLFEATDLVVTVDGAVVTNYTVSIVAQPAFGGSITFAAAPAIGAAILLRRILPFSRLVDYQQGGALPEGTLDDDQDAQTMLLQQVDASVQRALRVPSSDAVTLVDLPSAALRANLLLGFDSNGQPVAAAPVAGTAAALATTLASSIGSSLIGFIQSLTGAIATTVQAKLRRTIHVTDFSGVDNTGVSDSTVGLQAAINSGAGVLKWPGGTYLVGAAGLTGASNQIWEPDGTGEVVIRLTTTPTNDYFIGWFSKTKFKVRDLTIDFNGQVKALTLAIGGQLCTDFEISGCRVIGINEFGISFNGAQRFKILNNYIQKTVAANTQNQAIHSSTAAGAVTDGEICGNRCVNTAINCSGSRLIFERNVISDFRFGGGITLEADASTAQNEIRANIIYGGTGVDVNATACPGIENWGARTVIVDNIIFSNAGSGIDQGGQRCTVQGNICFNNGTTGGSGIVSRYADATYNAYESVYVGNRCFDTNGGAGTQVYGYEDQSASVAYVTLSGNTFKGNKTAPMNVLGSQVTFHGGNLRGSTTWDPPSIANNASGSLSITVSGAVLGDMAIASFSNDLQGMTISAYVDATNSVTVVLTNNSGGAKDLASGTLRVKVIKPVNHADY